MSHAADKIKVEDRERMNAETLQSSIDQVAAAVALGMDVDAVAGVTIYESYAEDQDEPGVVYVRGYHATRESAINELLAFALDVWDNDIPELAPWGDEDEEPSIDARLDWLTRNTDEEILNAYFGDDMWSVSTVKVAQSHAKPFVRA